MNYTSHLYFDWIDPKENIYIERLILELPMLFGSFSSALITCIDSSRHESLMHTAFLDDKLNSKGISYSHITAGIIVNPTTLSEFTEQSLNIFTGFDELWLFEEMPPSNITLPFSDRSVFTSEQPITESKVDWDAIAIWYERNKCVLGLGDGHGLNYITPRLSIAEQIEGTADPD